MSATSIAINKNQLKYIASDAGQPFAPGSQLTFLTGETSKVSPNITNGAIYFATKDNTKTSTIQINGTDVAIGHNRAYIFLDDNNKRYAVTGPVDWDEILNKPLNKILTNVTLSNKSLRLYALDNANAIKRSISLPFLYNNSDDTMYGHLTIEQDTNGSDNLTIQDETWPIIGLQSNSAYDADDSPITYWIEVPPSAPNDGTANVDLFVGRYGTAMRISPEGSITIPGGQSIGGYDYDGQDDIYFYGLASMATADASGNTITSTYYSNAALSNKTLSFKSSNNEVKQSIDLPFLYCNSSDTIKGSLTSTNKFIVQATENAPYSELWNNSIVFGNSSYSVSMSHTGDGAIQFSTGVVLDPVGGIILPSYSSIRCDSGYSTTAPIYFEGLATRASEDYLSNPIHTTYIKSSYIADNNTHTYVPLSNTNGHTLKYKLGSNGDSSATQNLPFVLLSGDTMTGALTIARSNSSTSPRVSLDYNDTTDSLDFIFA